MKNPKDPNVHVYFEQNPNPNSMKFVFSTMLLDDNFTLDYTAPEECATSPLALALFEEFPYIERIFFATNFITVTKNESVEWGTEASAIRTFIVDYFSAKKPVFEEGKGLQETQVIINDDREIVQQIKVVLDEYIRPGVEMDGGAIDFAEFDEVTGLLKVELKGACSGCPSSTITLKQGIKSLMGSMVPQVKDVESINA